MASAVLQTRLRPGRGPYDSGLQAGPDYRGGNPDFAFGIPYLRSDYDSLIGLNYRIKPCPVWNLSLRQEFKLAQMQALLVGADLLNVVDEKGPLQFPIVFGGTHVIPPRTLAPHFKFRF